MKFRRSLAAWLMMGAVTGLHAQTNFFWTNTVGGAWGTTGNWTNNTGGGGPTSGGNSNYWINFNVANTFTATNNSGNPIFKLNRLNFNAASGALTLYLGTGTNFVFLTGAAGAPQFNQNGLQTITITKGGMILSNDTTFAGAGTGAVSLNGVNISGPGRLTLNGSYLLTLSGTNTYGGGTTLTGGTLSISVYTNLPSTTGLTFNGGNLQVTGTTITNLNGYTVNWSSFNGGLDINNSGNTLTVTNAIGGTGSLTKNGAGTLLLSSPNTYNGPTLINAGTLTITDPKALGSGVSIITNSATLKFDTAALTVTNAMVMNNGTLYSATAADGSIWNGTIKLMTATTNTLDIASGSQPAFTVNGLISGGGALAKNSSGTLLLTNANAYTGGTIINAGTVSIQNNNALGSGTISNAGYLSFNTGSLNVTNTMVLNGGTLQGVSSLGNGIYSGPITLVNTGNFAGTSANNMLISGAIGGGGALTKSGTSTFTMTNNNSYGGGTTISGGTLVASNNNALGTGAVTMNGGTLANGAGGNFTIGNAFTVNHTSPGFISASAGNTFTLTGAVSSDNGAAYLTNSGPGTLVLSGVGDNVNLELYVQTGAVVLAKSPSASGVHAVAGISGVNAGATLQLAGSGGDQIYNGSYFGVYNMNGTFDFNGRSEEIDILTGTGVITNTSSTASTMTVGIGNGSSTFSGQIRNGVGTMALIKAGVGIFAPTGTNTYSGGTTIATGGGILQIATTNNIGSGAVLINSGGALAVLNETENINTVLTQYVSFASSGSYAINSNQAVNVNFNFSSGGGMTYTSLYIGAVGGQTAALTNGQYTPYGTTYRFGGGGGTLLYGGSIGGNSNVVINGLNGIVVFSGTNTYSGGTVINAGTLSIGVYTNLPAVGAFTLNGGVLQITGTIITNLNCYAGNWGTLNGGFDVADPGNTVTITNVSGTSTLVKYGAGTLLLPNANAYSGGTVVNAGTLLVKSTTGNGTGTGDITVDGTGVLTVNGGKIVSTTSSTTVGLSSGSQATMNITNGALFAYTGAVNNFYVGNNPGATGVVNIVNSAFTNSNAGANTYIGFNGGVGTMTFNNSTGYLNGASGTLFIGDGNGSSGTLNVTNGAQVTFYNNGAQYSWLLGQNGGSGTINVYSNSYLYLGNGGNNSIGYSGGTGTINVVGGRVVLAPYTGADNRLSLGGASHNANVAGGVGYLNISGGVFSNQLGDLYLGGVVVTGSCVGVMTVSGGQYVQSAAVADATNVVIGGVANGGKGTLIVTNTGVFSAPGAEVTVGNAGGNSGYMYLYGGTTTVAGITLTTVNNSTGKVYVAGGVLNIGSGGIVLNTGTGRDNTIQLSGGTIGAQTAWSSSAPMILTNSPGPGTATFDTTGGNITLSGILSGNGALSAQGTGTLTLSGPNTYTGGTTISNGILQVQNNSALGTGSANVLSGATLNVTGSLSITNSLTINGDGSANGAIDALSGNNIIGGLITLSGTAPARITSQGTSLTITGGVTGIANNVPSFTISLNGGAGHSLTITNKPILLGSSATFELTGGASGNTGVVAVAGNSMGTVLVDYTAVLKLGVDNPFTNVAALVMGVAASGAATVDLNGHPLSMASIADGGTAYSSEIITNSSTLATLTISNGSGNTTYDGIIGGAISLTKNGASEQVLSGTNTYTGATTVNSGTLAVNGLIANSAVTINSGGALAGTGTVSQSVTVNGGTLSPGNSIGTLTVGNLTLTNNPHLVFQLFAPGASDLVIVTNQFSWTGFMDTNWFILSAPNGLSTGTYTLVSAATSISGFLGSGTNFTSIGGIIGFNGFLSLENNNLDLIVVPEPSTGTLVVAGLLTMLLLRRRRRA